MSIHRLSQKRVGLVVTTIDSGWRKWRGTAALASHMTARQHSTTRALQPARHTSATSPPENERRSPMRAEMRNTSNKLPPGY